MMTGAYRKRLDTDLTRWVADGLLSADSAAAIRRSVASESGFRLPGLLGMFGGLLIAASVAAFVAANWEAMPRLFKLGMIFAGLIGALGLAARFESRGAAAAANSASTVAVLIFGAGIALIGQMYHLPADWPAGAMLVGLGALVTALLLRTDGPLVIALIATCAWTFGRWEENQAGAHLGFFILYLPALWLALSSRNRLVHQLTALALAMWLALLPGDWLNGRFDYALLAYGLAVSSAYVAIGAWALERGGSPLLVCCLPWGLLGLIFVLAIELARILDSSMVRAGTANTLSYISYAIALACIAAMVAQARSRRFAVPLAAALVASLLVPVIFWSGGAMALPGKVLVASVILLIAIVLVAAGAGGGVRRVTLAGTALFAIAVLILFWQTIGTLLDQSLFFLAAGALLLGLASGARRLLTRFAKPASPETAS